MSLFSRSTKLGPTYGQGRANERTCRLLQRVSFRLQGWSCLVGTCLGAGLHGLSSGRRSICHLLSLRRLTVSRCHSCLRACWRDLVLLRCELPCLLCLLGLLGCCDGRSGCGECSCRGTGWSRACRVLASCHLFTDVCVRCAIFDEYQAIHDSGILLDSSSTSEFTLRG